MKNNMLGSKMKMDFWADFVKKKSIMKMNEELLQEFENEMKNHEKNL